MSRSDRDNRAATRLIGAAIVAALGVAMYCAMFYSAGYGSGYNERQAHIEAKHYASDTPQQIERECGAKAGEATRECIAKIIDAERESQRSESDLAAQWKAADWVMWAGIIAGAQLIATALGLYFVKRTLDATLEAVEDTGKATVAMERQNELAARQQRPWVTIGLAEPFISRSDGGILLVCIVELGNIGATPAFDAHVDFALAPAIHNPIYDFQIVAENVCALVDADETVERLIVLPQGKARSQIFVSLTPNDPRHPFDDGVVPTFMVWANYALPDGSLAHTSAWFTVAPKNTPGHPGLIIWDVERLEGEEEPLLDIESHGYIRVT